MKELSEKYNILIMDPNNDMTEEESEEYGFKLDTLTDELFKVKTQKKK